MSSPAPADRRETLRRWAPAIGVAAFALALMGGVTLDGRPVGPSTGGELVYENTFEGPLGPEWVQSEPDLGWKAGTWKIEDGRLVAKDIHNAALWLKTPLPEKVRIEFVARALSDEGDVKAEAFGDGRTHQSGYIFINGGWKNTVNAIARLDEHGEDRKDDRRCASRGGKSRCVEPDVDYDWVIERTDGEVRWYLNGTLFLTWDDDHPLPGRHFAFNNWEAPVQFDDLRIYDLSGR